MTNNSDRWLLRSTNEAKYFWAENGIILELDEPDAKGEQDADALDTVEREIKFALLMAVHQQDIDE